MTTTPTDPAALDLKAFKAELQRAQSDLDDLRIPRNEAVELVAEVEALRERVAEHDSLFDLQLERERLWIERWREATGLHNTLPDYGEMLAWICGRAEAAEARVVELVEVLKPFADAVFNDNGDMTVGVASVSSYRDAYFTLYRGVTKTN